MQESKIFSEQNFSEKAHYVYRVTIDEKYYIGKRTGLLNDLATGRYKTSSKLIHEKLQNGHHFSKIKILQVFSSSRYALEFESRILSRVDAKRNPKFLNQTNGGNDFYITQHTEKTKEKMKERFNPETEQGRKRRENKSQSAQAQFDPNTEEGIKRRETHSEKMKEYFNPETEQGQIHLEENRRRQKERFNLETEEGQKNLENTKLLRQKGVKTQIQNRKDASILGELMFDEAFIRENFLITDDKNNLRFLWSVYSKLSGYKESSIAEEKREGKLSFLHGIKSIKLSEEDELAKIKEIEAIIKSRNEKNSKIP